MRRLFRPFIWLLLVPYFAVASLNVAPWIGESRANANRTNAQGAVALIFAFTLLAILSVSGSGRSLSPFLFAVATVVPSMIALGLLLNPEREQHYRALYTAMPRWKRAAFGMTTLVFTSLMLWLILREAR